GKIEITEDGPPTIFADDVLALDEAVQRKAQELVIRLPHKDEPAALCQRISEVLEQSKGSCEVFIEMEVDGSLVRMRAHPSLRVEGSVNLERALQELGCEIAWQTRTITRAAGA